MNDKQLPNAIRHDAQGFTFTTNIWTVERASVIVTTDIPADFNPSTHHTLVPAFMHPWLVHFTPCRESLELSQLPEDNSRWCLR